MKASIRKFNDVDINDVMYISLNNLEELVNLIRDNRWRGAILNLGPESSLMISTLNDEDVNKIVRSKKLNKE
jgi:hypothetical protein